MYIALAARAVEENKADESAAGQIGRRVAFALANCSQI